MFNQACRDKLERTNNRISVTRLIRVLHSVTKTRHFVQAKENKRRYLKPRP